LHRRVSSKGIFDKKEKKHSIVQCYALQSLAMYLYY